jgi:hypothetical protein
MDIDIHAKSLELLEALANSVHDRDLKSLNPFFFNISDTHVAEKWLKEFIKDFHKMQKPARGA